MLRYALLAVLLALALGATFVAAWTAGAALAVIVILMGTVALIGLGVFARMRKGLKG